LLRLAVNQQGLGDATLREQLNGCAPKVTNLGGEVKEMGYIRNVGSQVDPAQLQQKISGFFLT